jgi:hypothetical protein
MLVNSFELWKCNVLHAVILEKVETYSYLF